MQHTRGATPRHFQFDSSGSSLSTWIMAVWQSLLQVKACSIYIVFACFEFPAAFPCFPWFLLLLFYFLLLGGQWLISANQDSDKVSVFRHMLSSHPFLLHDPSFVPMQLQQLEFHSQMSSRHLRLGTLQPCKVAVMPSADDHVKASTSPLAWWSGLETSDPIAVFDCWQTLLQRLFKFITRSDENLNDSTYVR